MQDTVGSRVCTEVAQIATMATFQEAVQLLQYSGLQTLYVIDEDRRLLGLLPDYVLVKTLLHSPDDPPSIDELMCTTPTVLLSCTLMSVAAPLFRESRFDSLPVTENERLIGELHRRDVIAWLMHTRSTSASESEERNEQTLKGPAFLKRPILSCDSFRPRGIS